MANIMRRRRHENEREQGGELSRRGSPYPYGGQYFWDPLRTMSELLRWDPFGELSQGTSASGFFSERSFGEFRRSFTLPEGTDADGVSAQLKDGVLRIELKKRAEVQPRRISLGASKQTPASTEAPPKT